MNILKKLALCISAAAMFVQPMTVSAAVADTTTTGTAPLRVMCLGDSITDGFWYKGAYRIELCRLLHENGYSDKVDLVGPFSNGEGLYDPNHTGYTGWAIDPFTPDKNPAMDNRSGISQVVDQNLTDHPADVVLLQIGTNDILSAYELDSFETRMTNLANQILGHLDAETGVLYITTLPPMDANDTTYIKPNIFTVEIMDGYVAQCNQAIKNVVDNLQAQGKNVELADIASVVTKADLYDGVHPTQAGYEKMGAYWYEIVKGCVDAKFAPAETTTTTVAAESAVADTSTADDKADDDGGLGLGAGIAICVVGVVALAAAVIFVKKH